MKRGFVFYIAGGLITPPLVGLYAGYSGDQHLIERTYGRVPNWPLLIWPIPLMCIAIQTSEKFGDKLRQDKSHHD